ncbi:ATP-binding cassette domain-containing protein [Streptomyces roseus]|uniref:ATP-binding cassette domain-containing protein n=1 Tax=Streptomyces roseus TaxID=66430 RepID=UPI00340A0396
MGRRHGVRRPWVVRGIGLELPPGALVRVEGRNGGGKSTLLRFVAGIDTPSEGRVTGRPRRTAFVPERFPAALPLTATAYLTHMGRVHGLGRAQAADRAPHWLERFGATARPELDRAVAERTAAGAPWSSSTTTRRGSPAPPTRHRVEGTAPVPRREPAAAGP